MCSFCILTAKVLHACTFVCGFRDLLVLTRRTTIVWTVGFFNILLIVLVFILLVLRARLFGLEQIPGTIPAEKAYTN
jgi:hypothetical protein